MSQTVRFALLLGTACASELALPPSAPFNQCHEVDDTDSCGASSTPLCGTGFDITTREGCEEAARDLLVDFTFSYSGDSTQPLMVQSYNDITLLDGGIPGASTWAYEGSSSTWWPGCFTQGNNPTSIRKIWWNERIPFNFNTMNSNCRQVCMRTCSPSNEAFFEPCTCTRTHTVQHTVQSESNASGGAGSTTGPTI